MTSQPVSCWHGVKGYCAQCEAEYDDQETAVAQRLRRAEWIRNNVARLGEIDGVKWSVVVDCAEQLADELIKRGYL